MEVDEQQQAAAPPSAAAAAKDATPKAVEEKSGGEKADGDATAGDKKDESKKEGEAGADKAKDEKPEPTEEILNNPCRVLKAQTQFISFPAEIEGQPVRYTPLLKGKRRVGFLMLQDNRPEEAEDVFQEDE